MTSNPDGTNVESSEKREENGEKKTTQSKQPLAEDYEKLSSNIYETIIVIAKRARQIGDAQKREIDRQIGTFEPTESGEEEQPDEDAPEPEFYHYEKPTVLAMQEMVEGKVKSKYKK